MVGKKICVIIEFGLFGFFEFFVGECVLMIYVYGVYEGKMLEWIEKIVNTFEFEEMVVLGVFWIFEIVVLIFEVFFVNEYEMVYLFEDFDVLIDEFSGTTLDVGSFRVIDVERMEIVVYVIVCFVCVFVMNDKVDVLCLDVEGGKFVVKEFVKCFMNENYGLERCEFGKKFLYGEEASAFGFGEFFVDLVVLLFCYFDVL